MQNHFDDSDSASDSSQDQDEAQRTVDLDRADGVAELTPPRRAWGFVTFLVCALALAVTAGERQDSKSSHGPADLPSLAVLAQKETSTLAIASLIAGERDFSSLTPTPARAASLLVSAAPAGDEPASSSRYSSVITFAFDSIVTTEKTVAAVFVLERSEPLNRRALVQWESRSATADAAIGFSDASGTAVFAEGQAQAAVYVRLRDDLLKEADESFELCLRAPQRARLGEHDCIEATILDDD